MNREAVKGIAIVGTLVTGVGLAATALGQTGIGGPLLALAYYLMVILVVRPYVYERFGAEIGDWAVLILVLGPAALLLAPILWWEHHRPGSDPNGRPSVTGGFGS